MGGVFNNKRGRGYTLVEMSAVVVTLFLAAGLVVPNLVTIRRSRSLDDLKAAIGRLPVQAMNEARRSGAAVRLRVDGGTVILERQTQGVTGTDAVEVRRVPFSGALSVDGFRRGSESTDEASWEWDAYPDGTAMTGALIFRDGAAVRSLVLSRDGRGRWIAGEPPDSSQDEWSAGEIETRE